MQNKCNMCGYCCENILYIYPNIKKNREYIEARGYEIVQQTNRAIQIKIPSVCKSYNKHTKKCTKYKKPELCEEFPMNIVESIKSYGFKPSMVVSKTCGYIKMLEESK